MQFYDMIHSKSKMDEDKLPCELNELENSIPFEINEKLKNLNMNRLIDKTYDNRDLFLDEIWKKTLDICNDYINLDIFFKIGICKDELIEDIKIHTIFTMLISLRYRKKESESLNSFITRGISKEYLTERPNEFENIKKKLKN